MLLTPPLQSLNHRSYKGNKTPAAEKCCCHQQNCSHFPESSSETSLRTDRFFTSWLNSTGCHHSATKTPAASLQPQLLRLTKSPLVHLASFSQQYNVKCFNTRTDSPESHLMASCPRLAVRLLFLASFPRLYFYFIISRCSFSILSLHHTSLHVTGECQTRTLL